MSDVDLLKKSPVFGDLEDSLLQQLLDRGERRRLAEGDVLFEAGQPYLEALFIVLSGEAAIQRPDGSDYRVGVGEFLGLSSFLDLAPYSSTAVALEPMELLEFSTETFQELKQDFPVLSTAVNRSLAERIRRWTPDRRGDSGFLVQPVRSVMTVPLASCGPQTTLAAAFALMKARNMGSLGVVEESGELIGMVTPAILSEAVLLDRFSGDAAISSLGLTPPRTIEPSAPLWQAEQLQAETGVKYLVVEEDGIPVGVLSQTDILRNLCLQAQQSIMIRQAEEAVRIEELRDLFGKMEGCAEEALEHNRHASMAVRIVSETHLAINRRCVELTLERMDREGFGPAPIPYALLIMGSGGRREMMLDPDQDNGIILDDLPVAKNAKVANWFKEFCNRLNSNLDLIGYPLCPGDIMARNPQFHKTLAEWKAQISHMVKFPNEKAARWSNVVFDFDTLYGDDQLTVELRKHVHQELDEESRLLEFMMQDDAEGRPPIGFFNRLITTTEVGKKGKIDLKRNGLRIIADAARIFALSVGISTCNTNERLHALVRMGHLDADFADSILSAYEELIALLLDHQIEQRRQGKKLDKLIDPEALSPHSREMLRESMLAVKRFQERLQTKFGMLGF